jgi:predicted Zn finger-like uncharacterized protein
MSFECPSCQTPLPVDESDAGGMVKCVSCGQSVAVVVGQAPPAVPPVPPSIVPLAPPPVRDENPLADLAGIARQAKKTEHRNKRFLVGRFVSLDTRSVVVILCGLTLICAAVYEAWSDNARIQQLSGMTSYSVRSMGDYGPRSLREQAVIPTCAYVVTWMLFMICFMVWSHLAHKNLRPLGSRELRYTPGGAVGWWFCPILNLWKPYRVMQEIWQGSDFRTLESGRSISGWLLGLWWTAHLVGVVLSYAAGIALTKAHNLADIAHAMRLDMYSAILSGVFAALAITIVASVSGKQSQRRDVLIAAERRGNYS